MILSYIIENIQIDIYISDSLYYKNIGCLQVVFALFKVNNEVETFNAERSILVYDSYNGEQSFINRFPFKYVCPLNFKKDEWFFNLMAMLDQHYSDILNCTVLHGSCVKVNSKNIIFLGNRKSGKSTLTKLLIDLKDAVYIDDDAIFLFNNNVYGFNSPICLRKMADNDKKPFMIKTDTDGELRYIYKSYKSADKIGKIDYIVFPHYDKNFTKNMYEILPESMSNIIWNVKKSSSINKLYKDITSYFKNAEPYSIKYSESTAAMKAIEKLIYNRGNAR